MRYRTFTVDIEDWEGKCLWRCKLKVPMSERHEVEPPEFEVLSVTRTVHDISVSEVIEHSDLEAFESLYKEEIWTAIDEQLTTNGAY